MNPLQQHYLQIKKKIEHKLKALNRSSDSLKIVAITKGRSARAIADLIECGQIDFGENYVQEWKVKKQALSSISPSNLRWHFVGRLQTNKVKELVGHIHLFHSIDRLSLAEKINHEAQKAKVICEGLLEIDLAHESTKTGFLREELPQVLQQLNLYSFLNIRGLMLMPPLSDDPEKSRPYFKQLKEILFDLNKQKIYKNPLIELSMGMSNDYEVALEEGATFIRIGRTLFKDFHEQSQS
ncbi:MAG: YggS family pyridoxal phosphate-dependent enzyme [Deltaproteobacteria bacterium]|nr:YggS family pyridoxal phosphate-dependent enzyme [Deltaproteobacteria bacterium]